MISREETAKWIGGISAICLTFAFLGTIALCTINFKGQLRFGIMFVAVTIVIHLVMEYFEKEIQKRI
jgi:phosphate starvation-inducible membrane PsiE